MSVIHVLASTNSLPTRHTSISQRPSQCSVITQNASLLPEQKLYMICIGREGDQVQPWRQSIWKMCRVGQCPGAALLPLTVMLNVAHY